MEDLRSPYTEKQVKNIKQDDGKISISGTIISREGNIFFLDDGTGQVKIACENMPSSDYVRVFGRIVPYSEHVEIQAEVIQDLSKVDKQLYNKIKKILAKEVYRTMTYVTAQNTHMQESCLQDYYVVDSGYNADGRAQDYCHKS